MSEGITLDIFQQMTRKAKSLPPSVVGIVCKPSLEMAIRATGNAIKRAHYPFLDYGGVPVYTDLHQANDALIFTSVVWLHAYLNRRKDPDKWVRVLMRNLLKGDKGRASIYRIPFALPMISTF